MWLLLVACLYIAVPILGILTLAAGFAVVVKVR
jgi:hypothetical protein